VVRQAEDRGQTARHEGHEVEHGHRQRAGPGEDRHQCDQPGAAEIGPDHQRSAAHPVDQHAEQQHRPKERQLAGTIQQAHLKRGRMQVQNGGQRQGQHRHLAAEGGHRLPQPEPVEVTVPGQPPGRVRLQQGRRSG